MTLGIGRLTITEHVHGENTFEIIFANLSKSFAATSMNTYI
jgi:hypothetical protein